MLESLAVVSTCPKAPLERFGRHPWSSWGPRRVPGDKPGTPRKCLTHKIDVLQVAALPCFVRDDAARKSLTQSRNSQVDILKLAGRRPAMIRTHCEPVETMSDIIALGNTTHLTFWTIEWLRRVSESHVFMDVYGMFIRICLSPPFFVLFGRPKRKHMCSSLPEIDLLKTLYFLLNNLFTLRTACCRSYLHKSRTCFTSVCVSCSASFSLSFSLHGSPNNELMCIV